VSKFEYVTVLMSIVIAYAISEILSGWGQLLRMRRHVRPWWPHTLWTLLVLLLLMQVWWGTWEYRHLELDRFAALLMLVAPQLAAVIAVSILMPDLTKREVDLRAHFMENRRWFFVFAALTVALLVAVDAFIGGQPVLHAENGIRVAAIGLLLGLSRSESERVHQVALVVLYALLLLFIRFAFRAA
jgi:hypothetical protein